MYLGDSTSARPEEDEDEVVQDLEDGDEAAAHRQALDSAHVGHEPGIKQLNYSQLLNEYNPETFANF